MLVLVLSRLLRDIFFPSSYSHFIPLFVTHSNIQCQFVHRLYVPLFAFLTIGLPVMIPYYYWSESLWISFWVNFNLRFCVTLNIAFFVNSVAHMWGQRPYDKYVYRILRLKILNFQT